MNAYSQTGARLRPRARLLQFVSAAALLSTPALADTPKWGAHLDFEGRWSNARSLGDMGLFAPLWQSRDALLFTDIRGKFDSQEGREGNFGLGFRQMLHNGWNVGAYGYYDVRRSPLGNQFQQVTLGAEAMSADFDIRANVYLPFGSTSRQIGVTGGGNPFAEFANNTIRIVTPSTHAVIERAMTGFDGEIGWRAPVFDVESLTQLRLYGGGYYFSGGGVARDVAGPRGRLEFSFDDVAGWAGARLTFGAEVQHDDVRGTQGIGLARLRIPLQQHKAYARLSPQERRMTERVVRDVDIVSGTGRGAQISAEVREDAINSWNGQVVTSARQVSPADQAALQAALIAEGAGSVVILNGALAGVTAATTVGVNQTLIGGGTTLALKGATTGTVVNFLAPGAGGDISGSVGAVAPQFDGIVRASSGSVIGGLALTNSADRGAGVLVDSANDVTAFGNTINTSGALEAGIRFHNASHGLVIGNAIRTSGFNAGGVASWHSNNIVVAGNRLTMFGGVSHGVALLDSPDVTVRDNIIAVRGSISFGVFVRYADSTNALVTGNRIASAISGGVFVGDAASAIVSHNVFGPIGGAVIHVQAGATFLPGSTGNVVSDKPMPGRCASIGAGNSGIVEFTDGLNCVFP